ncbi:class I SAM-dependent methyltransferase [Vitiosangium sp. GDMCC 1.1324]|uniref:class I SAM-dependent methyltransferase n=1 Tax=Vitiosangium sp. (strain GDMCC 1.1324) TaxID=2138576 RepID=UPI000D36D65A|nr:class I SAM-dependent methyltransferase [Vitiosangium sp. GDMCC 1.1324]PTL79275.1 methyltransferase [Vitiosangium sp. GDMCC 1.1324]
MAESSPASSQTAFVQQLNFWARDASNESAALLGAFSLGLFAQLPDEGSAPPVSLESLAQRIGGTVRGTRSVIEPLVGLGFVRLEEGRGYSLPVESAFLRGSGFTARMREALGWWLVSAKLPESVRTGAPVDWHGESRDLLGLYRREFLAPRAPAPSAAAEDYDDRAVRGFLRTQALVTSGEVGLLEAMVSGPRPLVELAKVTGSQPEALRVVLGVLVSMGIVRQEGEAFGFTELAGRSLDASSLPYFQRAFPATMDYWEAFGHLDEAVTQARFRLDLRDPEVAKRIYQRNASRITGIFASHVKLGRKAAELVGTLRPLKDARVLDVGTGSGVWGAAFALTDPSVHVTYLDSEHVLEQVKPNIAKLKLEGRARYWAGDCLSVDYGESQYDVILLPQVIPALPPESLPSFFGKLARALRPRGLLVVSGYLLTDRRDGSLDALYFSLRRYVSNEGDVLSMPDFRRLLEPVGLSSSRGFEMPIQQVVIASRGDVPWPDTAPSR